MPVCAPVSVCVCVSVLMSVCLYLHVSATFCVCFCMCLLICLCLCVSVSLCLILCVCVCLRPSVRVSVRAGTYGDYSDVAIWVQPFGYSYGFVFSFTDPGPHPSLTLHVPLSLSGTCGPFLIPAPAACFIPPAPSCSVSSVELTQVHGPALSCSWWDEDAVSAALFQGPAPLGHIHSL